MRLVILTAALLSVVTLASLPTLAAAQMGAMGASSSAPSGPDPQQAYSAGVAAYQAQNYPEAIRQLRIARRAAPNNAGLNFALGLAYNGAGQKTDAQDAFAHAIRGANAPVGAWLQLGLVSLELGDRTKATEQQTALQQMLTNCDPACGDARRGQLQIAYDQLTRALNAPAPAATP